MARAKASWSIGVILEPLQFHRLVVAQRARLRPRRLQRAAAKAKMEPLGELAQLAGDVAIDRKPRARLPVHHHATLLELKGGLFSHHRQFSPSAKQANVTPLKLAGRAIGDQADEGL